ncbi:SDR family oxidoreductase [Thalassospiraceae bacterium LMO-JJ14]|nr:SDR family oxidoreductase [Thalassospiraceae bacterium LMO-JJ14]
MKSNLMKGKRGLIMGVANDHSIAWGIANTLAAHGAEMGFTYQNDAIERRVRPLAEGVGSKVIVPCDVEDEGSIAAAVGACADAWGSIDFVVHAIAYSDKQELKGKYVATTRENFQRTMDVSCYSFTSLARHAAPHMKDGGSMIALSFYGAEKVVPNYNVMGVAKAALEASIRYLASDLGPENIRVNAISAGPMRTLAGSAIAGARHIFKWNEQHSPLRRNVQLDDIGGSALYLLSDLSLSVTGSVQYVDSGYNIVGVPYPHKDEG